jgi:hypothetical protein
MDENVVYGEQAKKGEGYLLLEKATAMLKEVLGDSWGQIHVVWDRGEDVRGRGVYTLKLRDFTGEAETQFAPEELAHPTQMRFRLSRAWGNLLQVRNHRQMQQLKEAGTED